MKYTIGKFDPAIGSVPVHFSHGGIVHRRNVNACLTEAGAFDAEATKLRVADVALGVATKIDIGAITAEQTPL